MKDPRKKRNCSDTAWKCDWSVRSEYGSQTPGLIEGPSDVVYQMCGFHSCASEAPTFIEKDNESVSESVLSLLNEFVDITLGVAKQANGWIALQLVGLLTDASFELDILQRYIHHPADC